MKQSPPDRRLLQQSFAMTIYFVASTACGQQADPLPSWNDGDAKQAIVAFVDTVTKDDSPEFVPPAERIAVFDNDGTLWCEQPLYFQGLFAVDRVKALAPDHPEWKNQEPFKSVLAGETAKLAAAGEKGLLEIVAATHANITTDEFDEKVSDWIKTARHPKFNRAYTSLVYRPMLELLGYLRENGFKTFIVSGGGIEFIRVFAEETYGIPPEQVVGSSGVTKYELQDDRPVLVKEPKVLLIDDGPGKPVGIETFIGRRPIMAFGNSDGDYEMLRWTTAGDGPRFGLIVHHDDAEREYAYDRNSQIGKLSKALEEAPTRSWTVVSMKGDWRDIFVAE